MAENLKRGNEETATIAQIEDLDGLETVDEIASVEGVDCLFIGRIDLTIALGAASPNDKIVVDAVETICAAGVKANRRIGMFVGDMNEIPKWRKAGASLYVLKSDHSFILDGAKTLREQFDQQCASTE